jgi:hypothetical protein
MSQKNNEMVLALKGIYSFVIALERSNFKFINSEWTPQKVVNEFFY